MWVGGGGVRASACACNKSAASGSCCCVCVSAQGDYVEILIMTKDGVRREELTLKLD